MNRREAVTQALLRLAPGMPDHEAGTVIDHALASIGLRGAAPESAAWLSLVSYARHTFTEYDALLADGYDQASARHFVREAMSEVLREWGVRRPVGEEP